MSASEQHELEVMPLTTVFLHLTFHGKVILLDKKKTWKDRNKSRLSSPEDVG